MDPIGSIMPAKDSTLAMLLEAQRREYEIAYFEQTDIRISNGDPVATVRRLRVADRSAQWFELGEPTQMNLGELDVILMRKDPPFDMEYIYTTYILERAEGHGVLVVNRPASLRDINEKAFTAWFPQCCPETLITRSIKDMRSFLLSHEKIVVKPLHGMGGKSVFVTSREDNNANVILETLTADGTMFAIAQRYIPEIISGDKRIILVDGHPTGYALARIPPEGDNRGNLVIGAQAEIRDLSKRDRWICAEVGPVLHKRGVIFAGLDVIGDYLTEINVTSPTGIRELAKLGNIDVAADLMDSIESAIPAGAPASL
jgi:glutathione synthase